MEHKIEIKKELTITTQDVVDYVLCCEAGGFDYWAEICYKEEDYTAAWARLLGPDNKSEADICYEDVLADILERGCADGSHGKLTVYDREEDKEHELTLEKLLDGWKKYVEKSGNDDFDQYDADNADGILQYAIFGDWIYG